MPRRQRHRKLRSLPGFARFGRGTAVAAPLRDAGLAGGRRSGIGESARLQPNSEPTGQARRCSIAVRPAWTTSTSAPAATRHRHALPHGGGRQRPRPGPGALPDGDQGGDAGDEGESVERQRGPLPPGALTGHEERRDGGGGTDEDARPQVSAGRRPGDDHRRGRAARGGGQGSCPRGTQARRGHHDRDGPQPRAGGGQARTHPPRRPEHRLRAGDVLERRRAPPPGGGGHGRGDGRRRQRPPRREGEQCCEHERITARQDRQHQRRGGRRDPPPARAHPWPRMKVRARWFHEHDGHTSTT